jgi:pimeloyl-ACP methyl ester carboxylesterase
MGALRVVTAGTGDPLLLLHGFGLSPMTYLRTIDLLAADNRVLAPWLRCTDTVWDFDTLVDSVAATLDANQVDRVRVVGHSFGGAIAIGLTARHPERVSSLLAVDCLGLSPGLKEISRRAFSRGTLRLAHVNVARDVLAYAARSPRELASAAWWGFKCDLVEAAEAVRVSSVPRSVLWAEDDALLPAWLGARTAERLGSEFRVVPSDPPALRVNHDWPYRHPALFAEHVAASLPAA